MIVALTREEMLSIAEQYITNKFNFSYSDNSFSSSNNKKLVVEATYVGYPETINVSIAPVDNTNKEEETSC